MILLVQVSCIDEIFKALLDDEEQKLHSLTDNNSRIRLVATVLSAYEVCLCRNDLFVSNIHLIDYSS